MRALPSPGADADLLASYCLSLWRRTAHDRASYSIKIDSSFPPHVGLASSAAIQNAIFIGLNWLNGLPLSEGEILTAVGDGYREVVNGGLRKGFTTGLSCALNCFGGFAFIDTKREIQSRIGLPSWSYAIGLLPSQHGRSFGSDEARVLMGNGRAFDSVDNRRKLGVVRTELLPALRTTNLLEIGKAVRHLQTLGSKKAEMAIYGERAIHTIDALCKSGIECPYLSAVGPGIVALSSASQADTAKLATRSGLKVIKSGSVDSLGAIIEPLLPGP